MKSILILTLSTSFLFAADRTRDLEAKAIHHEREADRLALAAQKSPMQSKWPAIANAPAERERRLAMQARRAWSEARVAEAKAKTKSSSQPSQAGQ
jgi:hypothetical protein